VHLDIHHDGPVVRITLNRPDVRNAFDDVLIGELTDWAESVSPAAGTRAAVLLGAGRAFCAGADLSWMSRMITYSHDENVRDARALGRMFSALNSLPIPLIGRIHGAALGGGAGLAAVCDIVVAAEDAIFGFTEVKLGILPAVISPYVVSKIGPSAARELFLTGSRFPAARAKEIGLVHVVAEEGELDRVIAKHVNDVLTSGPEAVAAAKRLIAEIAHKTPAQALEQTAEAIAGQRVSPEGQEGMRAFLDKRKPSWTDGLE
jgi:methylglutaconyl-CoA hydratase